MGGEQLSHWGWGLAGRFPSRAARLALAARLRLGLGFGLGWPREPRPLASVQLPRPRQEVPPPLAAFATAAAEARIHHTYGRAYRDLVRGFYGTFKAAPDLVARPRDEDEIDAVLAWAEKAGVAVVPYGGGSNVVGATECRGEHYNGVLSLDTGQLDRVLEVDEISRAARIQAGATGPVLEAQLAQHGMTLRHFPQSFEHSTLGGWLATRSGGHFATGYTHIDDFVQSVRMSTPIGINESRRLPASGAGPSPDRLVLGSEGTLGVITEAWMRILPRPTHRSRADVFFDSFADAVEAARAIVQSGLRPANCRLLDPREARLHRVVDDGSSVLILGFESAGLDLRDSMDQALDLARKHGGRCRRGARHRNSENTERAAGAGASWRRAFFDAPYLQTHLVSLGVMADTFETACTWDRFPELHLALREEVTATLRKLTGKGFLSCRFTHVYPDGPAPYYTFLAPVRRGAELEIWQEVKDTASRILLRHGATITHHHAVGRIHRPAYLEQMPAPTLVALRAARSALDPAGILNPGALFTEDSGSE